jgi:S-adenosylmethionine:tRNA ribosyltransferase-isomerase
MLKTSELDYHLPDSAIAVQPASPRDSARLMVVERASGSVRHLAVRDLPSVLNAEDLLVRNSTRVLPARFRGVREDTGGKVEGLYLEDVTSLAGSDKPRCRVLLKMRRHTAGAAIRLADREGVLTNLRLVIEGRVGEEPAAGEERADSGWVVCIEGASAGLNWLQRVGLTPLPPYILAARRHRELSSADGDDRASYQTVFASEPDHAAARPEHGSVAAPTAGLHFTPELLQALTARGVHAADVVLHVGLGTFKPVETEFVEEHPMHTEWCLVPRQTARAVRAAKSTGARVIAVGTTAARTLESFPSVDAMEADGECSTRILITPGYEWMHVDALLTNFHLPQSTLMAMVSALLPGGATQLRSLYEEAIGEGYRFYSFGDAMLVL